MSYSLLIVDMQYTFTASRKKTTKQACLREIRKAIRDKAAIVFVEYEGHGHTSPTLLRVVKQAKYARVYTVIKRDDDGSKEVKACLRKNRLPSRNLRVCGVNTDYCVLDTVDGLTHKLPNSTFRIISDACNSDWEHLEGLDIMRHLPNTRLVRAPRFAQ